MPTPTTGQKINGKVYAHSSIEVKFGSLISSQVEEISWSASLEPGKLRGTSPAVLGRTTGEGDCEGSVKMGLEHYEALIAELGDGYMEIDFQIVVKYAVAGANTQVFELNGVRITSDDTNSSGTDPTMVEFDIHIMELKRNGLRPYIA